MESARKSARERKPTARYADDATDALDFDSIASGSRPISPVEDESEEEYVANQDEVEDEAENDLFVDEGASASDAEAQWAGEDESVVGSSAPATPRPQAKPKGRFAVLKARRDSPDAATRTHIRGTSEVHKSKGSKDSKAIATFGSGAEDLRPVVEAQAKWFDVTTLPTRREDSYGMGGFGYSFFYTEEMREQERSKSWEWYFSRGGRDAFVSRQQQTHLTAEEALVYLPRGQDDSLNFLMGPAQNQKLFKLKTGQSMNISEAWTRSSTENDEDTGSDGTIKSSRQGWMLNLGTRTQSLEWVPNQQGPTQHLSVSLVQKEPGKEEAPLKRSYKSRAPAFSPSPSYPASLQIWAFEASTDPIDDGRVDGDKPPSLQLVICTNWGSIRRHKWCPVPIDSAHVAEEGHVRLGFLAALFTDGAVRVLDISYVKSSTPSLQYIHIKTAAFAARPPDTVCTSIAWLSSTHIAASCANGSVAVWSIPDSLKQNPPPGSSPRPWFYHQLHQSYILAITSAYPSRPHFIATSSMDGYVRLTDLRAPTLDTVVAPRVRVGIPDIVWIDAIQTFVAGDDTHLVRMYPLRRFHSLNSTARTDGPILALAASPCHPCVLVATADGKVVATNPLRRVMEAKVEPWQQIWFGHEWRRPVAQPLSALPALAPVSTDADADAMDVDPAPASAATVDPTALLSTPLVRITDGHKVVNPSLATNYQKVPGSLYDGVVFSTVYEFPTAVAQVAWNPNLAHAGWAAAGTGSGLVRVEDVGI